ncbi:MAG: ABC transporter ATP-binding protein [Coriobacteriales bacterium]|nr:ABC transporter ATP-binding protein [Coriobacteriales bacterium]
MIAIDHVSYRYHRAEIPSLQDVSLTIGDGECVLLCGASGSGKTTLTRLINGLVPHYYEGHMEGSVCVDGLDVTRAELYETSRVVGSVFQNPRSQFFCVDSTSELAFACENLGMPKDEILLRVAEAANDMGIEDLLSRSLFALSGGEKQKIACASVAALHPNVFVLDEPSSNLDLASIDDLAGQLRKWKARGKTIVIAEHRLRWLRDVCDRVVCMKNGRVAFDLPMEDFARFTDDDFRVHGLRSINAPSDFVPMDAGHASGAGRHMTLRDFRYAYGGVQALDIDELALPAGEVIAVVGSNGAGKSTFAKSLCGQLRKSKACVETSGVRRTRRALAKHSYMVMQDVNHQLFCETVDEELRLGTDAGDEQVANMLEALELSDLADRHPMSLSGGQKQRVAVASALLSNKDLLVFDEPTSGMDFASMERTAALLRSLRGKASVFVVTHDPDLVRRCCTCVLRLEAGRVAGVTGVATR